ncbi:MAG: hypothetical protein CM15mP89_3920 [Gammaproteobacteria bacterium]|nr:MAG: hypothetical protein CM15mP89_3920 [Gammaproteobacteria bacterium]
MPCVFPILSLKVLSFATGDPSEHRGTVLPIWQASCARFC